MNGSISSKMKGGENCDDREQGQITLDYLVAITIFLFTIFFVFQYTSGLFTPFESNSDEVTLIADRVSTQVIEDTVSAHNAGIPNAVDSSKLDTFFSQLNSDYQNTIDSLGLESSYFSYNFNITLENRTGIVNSAGQELPTSGNIGQTRRIVVLVNDNSPDTEMATVSFRVW